MDHHEDAFRAALLDPAQPVPKGLLDGAGQPTQKRFDVYRNNVTVALIEALRAAFPVVRKLLGNANFDQLAPLYARAHPPKSPLMMHYGADMPPFLEGFAPLKHIGYLADVARLELAMRRAYHAADATPLEAARLAEVDPDTLMASTLGLAPAVQCVPSPWPLFDIWRFNMQDGAEKPRAQPQSVLITRADFDPLPHPLTAAETAWLSAIGTKATFSDAQDAAAALDPDFDLSPLLTVLLQHGALTTLTPQRTDT